MKKKMSVKNIRKQVIVNVDSQIELEDLYIILLDKASKEKQQEIEQIKKQSEIFELYKNFNPRYLEEANPIKEAIEKVYNSNIVFGSKFNMIRVY
ncbi:MAG: hypothetical protein ACFFG0_50270 [Candidatus Thorarchaeota archaeon]